MKYVDKKNSGFSLLEILISLVVLSMGMMGLAGLQIASLKGTNEAHFRHEASLLMMDMADRMRANLPGTDKGAYRSVNAVNCTAEPSKSCDTVECTSEELAVYDMYAIACGITNGSQRSNGIRNVLPEGTLTINCDGGDCSTVGGIKKTHDIRITWKESKNKSEDATESTYNDRNIDLSIIP